MLSEDRRAEVLRLLGLARRAGAVVSGTEAVRGAIRQGEARMVLLAEDVSGPQLKKVERTLENRSIPTAKLGTRAILGAAVGRAPVSAVAVTGGSFARQVQRKLDPQAERAPDGVEE